MRYLLIALLCAEVVAVGQPPASRSWLDAPVARHWKQLEWIWDLAGLKASGVDISIWRAYFAFLKEQSRPGFTWMLGADRATAERGFRDGTHMAFALREHTLGLTRQGEAEAVLRALAAGRDQNRLGLMPAMFRGLARKSPAYQMRFMAALEKASVLHLQRPSHALGTLASRPVEVCLPEERFGFAATPGALPVHRSRFFEAKKQRLRPLWGVYLGDRQGPYEEGFQGGVALWDWDSHGIMTPQMGQGLFKTALRGKPPSFRLGFLAGMEARAAFLAQESRLQVRIQPPARTLADLPFTAEFMGFVPESLRIPAEEAKQGRTPLEILGLHRIEKCVVDFPGKDVEAIRGALAHARCVGTEADNPFHRPPGTRAYLQGYDGRTLPFQVFSGNWVLAGGMCFVVK